MLKQRKGLCWWGRVFSGTSKTMKYSTIQEGQFGWLICWSLIRHTNTAQIYNIMRKDCPNQQNNHAGNFFLSWLRGTLFYFTFISPRSLLRLKSSFSARPRQFKQKLNTTDMEMQYQRQEGEAKSSSNETIAFLFHMVERSLRQEVT